MGSHSNKFNSLRYSFVRVLFKQLIIKMMKIAVLAFALFAAVIAEPEAEASPDAYYGYTGYGLRSWVWLWSLWQIRIWWIRIWWIRPWIRIRTLPWQEIR